MELGQTQPLDEEEENKLWREFKKTKSSALRDKFIRQYMPLVKYVAGKVSVGLPASIEYDDSASVSLDFWMPSQNLILIKA